MGLTYFFVSLALQGLFKNRMRDLGPIISNVLAAAITFGLGQLAPETLSPQMLAAATALGCVAHIAGDAPTHSGVPFLLRFSVSVARRGMTFTCCRRV